MRLETLLALITVFAPLSLAAIGGVSSVFATIQHQSVDMRHWVTNREFVELFAIARGTPGPGSMLVTLIGWKAAGLLGALVATASLYLPSSLVVLLVSKVWHRFSGRSWHTALQAGLAPVGTGLMVAGIAAIVQATESGPLSWLVAAGAALAMTGLPKVNPLAFLCCGGALFVCFGWQ